MSHVRFLRALGPDYLIDRLGVAAEGDFAAMQASDPDYREIPPDVSVNLGDTLDPVTMTVTPAPQAEG